MEKDLDAIIEGQMSRGFNMGYDLAKHKPDLYKDIVKNLGKSDDYYTKGMLSGGKAYEMEKFKDLSLKKEKVIVKQPTKDIGDRDR